MLSADRFRRLYLTLPPTVSREIISVYDLLTIAGNGNWRRTYFEKNGEGLRAYLLDGQNRVLRQIDVPSSILMQMDHESSAVVENLEDLLNFKNRIYPATRFFEALSAYPDDVRRNMILNPEAILEQSGRVVRVGISDEAVSGYIQLGFEFINGNRRQVILAQGHEWAVWRLRSKLEDRRASSQPIDAYLEDQPAR